MSRVGIDIGGTFTDVVHHGPEGVRIAKVASTPDPADGFVAGLSRVGAASEVLHGTTVATNAVIQRRGARVAFLATEGFRHILHLARQDRSSLYDLRAQRPAPLVDVDLCVGVPERVGPDGSVLRPLDPEELRRRLEPLRGRVDAVAVTLLHSYANPDHERAVADVVAEALPGVSISLSCDVLPEFREYERASTTALNAFVQPVMTRYLSRLGESASRLGVMWSSGGVRGGAATIRRPVQTLLSGPAAGVVGAARVAAQAGFGDIVTLDMGGTSADVAIVDDRTPSVAEESELDGLPFRTPCVDVVSVGAGGGSIAWVDTGGALRVGPHSAGADPGPAAYRRGGTEATVTDAHVVLGHLGEEGLAGGEIALDREAAAAALDRVAAAAGLDPASAAEGVLRVVRATMARAVRSVSVERGKDVRRYALVAFGGAGPLHGTALASELGMSTVLVPPSPGTLAAMGLLVSPRRADASRSSPMRLEPGAEPSVRELLARVEAEARDELEAEGAEVDTVELSVDCRYEGQSYELRLTVDDPGPEVVGFLDAAMALAHEDRYGFSSVRPVTAVTFRAAALAAPTDVAHAVPRAGAQPSPSGVRTVGGKEVSVWERGVLPAGWVCHGPAVVTELDSTTWVQPGSRLTVHPTGTLVLEV